MEWQFGNAAVTSRLVQQKWGDQMLTFKVKYT